MAVTSLSVPAAPSALFVITNTDTDETDDLAFNGSKTLKQVKINNSANTTVFYLQLWDDNNPVSVTPGTTEPQAVFSALPARPSAMSFRADWRSPRESSWQEPRTWLLRLIHPALRLQR